MLLFEHFATERNERADELAKRWCNMSVPQVLEAGHEVGAFGLTVYELADGLRPEAVSPQ